MPVNGEAPVPKETVSSVLRTGCTDPAVDSGDTVVVGTGVAGYSAVIAARRHGADDFPLERASRSGVDCEKTAMAASWIGVARPSRISMAWGSASPPRSARHTRPLEQHPVGDVYAFRFAIHENFLAGNVRDEGGFQRVRQSSELRSPQTGGACTGCAHFDACRGGCMAAKFFTGLPLDGPDPECVRGYGEAALAARDGSTVMPDGQLDDSHSGPVRGQPTLLGMPAIPAKICDESPLAA